MNPKFKKKLTRSFTIAITLLMLSATVFAEKVAIFSDNTIAQIKFATGDVKSALEAKGFSVEMLPLSSLKAGYAHKKVIVALSSNKTVAKMLAAQAVSIPATLGEQAYALRTTTKDQTTYWVLGGDVKGTMYGTLQIAENISFSGFTGIYNNEEKPFMLNRGMKLNLPLDNRLPTYVGKWTSNSAKKAIPHVWDITFWKKLIDQQARQRYNMLSVWVHHPFPALVKLADYPKASIPRIEGFDGYVKNWNHEQRVAFWREVMQYAHDRGMSFYFFNWNIHLEYAKDQYPAIKEDVKNATTLDYMYKSMQALITTYPELDGFGISAGDGMHNPAEINVDWTWNAMGKAVNDYLKANPSRKFTLIQRSIGSSPEVWNKVYAPLKALPNATMNYSAKYALAHMYSIPAPRWTGVVESVAALKMKTWITVRNDDYFYLNWGDPKFVRDFMAGIPAKDAVVGMYIGSDGYNPTRTYFCKDNAMNGQLEVERRWYMEMLWGRIAYNPNINDEVFVNILGKRYPKIAADKLFEAWSLASRSLPKVTELVMGEWKLDFDWYPEACWSSPTKGTGFRTIDGFANNTTTAKGSLLCDIAKSAVDSCGGKKSSYVLADEIQADATKALALVNAINGSGNADLEMAIKNVKQMAYLSTYYASKIRGATFKKAGKIEQARDQMANAYCWWMTYSRAMEETYVADSFRNTSIAPDWTFGDKAVLKEYTDLGGVGIPTLK